MIKETQNQDVINLLAEFEAEHQKVVGKFLDQCQKSKFVFDGEALSSITIEICHIYTTSIVAAIGSLFKVAEVYAQAIGGEPQKLIQKVMPNIENMLHEMIKHKIDVLNKKVFK